MERDREATLRLLSEAQTIHDRIPPAPAEKSVMLEEARRRAKERILLSDKPEKPVRRYQDGTEEKEPAFNYSRYEEDSKSRTESSVLSKPTKIMSVNANDKDSVEFKHFIDKEYMQLKQELENLKRGSKITQRETKKPVVPDKSASPLVSQAWQPEIEIKYKERPTRDVEAMPLRLKVPQKLAEAPVESVSAKRSPSTRVFTTESSRIDIVPDTSRKSPISSERGNNDRRAQRKSMQKLDTSELASVAVGPSPSTPTREGQGRSVVYNNEPPQYQHPPQRRGWNQEYPPQQPVWNPGYNQYAPYPYPVYQYPLYQYNYPYHYQEPNYQYPPPSTSPAPSYGDLQSSSRGNYEGSGREPGGRESREEDQERNLIKEQTFGKSDDKRKAIEDEMREAREEYGASEVGCKNVEFGEEEDVGDWLDVEQTKIFHRENKVISDREQGFMGKVSGSENERKREIDEQRESESKEKQKRESNKRENERRENERRENERRESERRDNEKTVIDIPYSRTKDNEKVKVREAGRVDTDLEIINLKDPESNIEIVDQFAVKQRKPVLIEIGSKEKKSLADMFKEKNKKVVERIHNREDHLLKQDHKAKTKEELIEIRKNFVKPPKLDPKRADLIEVQIEEKKSGKEPSSELMERLATGQRVKITKEEMMKLNKKNYKMLPEVKKRQEEEQKKLEKQQRIQKAKDYEKIRYMQNRQDKQKFKYLPEDY